MAQQKNSGGGKGSDPKRSTTGQVPAQGAAPPKTTTGQIPVQGAAPGGHAPAGGSGFEAAAAPKPPTAMTSHQKQALGRPSPT